MISTLTLHAFNEEQYLQTWGNSIMKWELEQAQVR